MVIINKNDFIELEFTGKANNEIFDTTHKEEAKEMGLDADVKPIVISVGNQMLLKGFDEALEGKEIGKKYTVNLSPENAFGKRNPSMIKIIPLKVFHQQKINPVPGMVLHLDQYIVKILSVSGGRVNVDFNNPLAGKEISYEFTARKKIEDDKEKINSLQDFFFRKRFDFEIKDKKVIFKDETIRPFVEIFKQKFKDMTGFDFEVIENDNFQGPQKSKISEVEEKKEKVEKKTEEKK